jgi:hypothetical protein
VQFKPAGALVNGFVQVSLGGGVERRSSFDSQTMTAAQDENSAVFPHKQQPDFDGVRATIESAMAAAHAARAAAGADSSTSSGNWPNSVMPVSSRLGSSTSRRRSCSTAGEAAA